MKSKILPFVIYLAIPLALLYFVFNYAPLINIDDVFIMLWCGRALLEYDWFVNYNFHYQEMASSIIGVPAAYASYTLAPTLPFLFNKPLCVLAASASLWVCYSSRDVFFPRAPHYMTLAVFISLCSSVFYYWAGGMLEQPYYCLLLCIYVCALCALHLSYSTLKMATLCAALSGLMLVRPETVWILFMHLFLAFVLPSEKRVRNACIAAFLTAAAVYAGLLAIRWFGFGYLFPNPVYAKTTFMYFPLATLNRAAVYLKLYYLKYGLVSWIHLGVLAYSVGLWLTFLWHRIRGTHFQVYIPHLIVAGVLTAYHIALLIMGGDWMHYRRFLMPVIPLLNIVLLGLLSRFFTYGTRPALLACVALIVAALLQVGMIDPRDRLHKETTNAPPFVPIELHSGMSLSQISDALEHDQLRRRTPYVMEFVENELPKWIEREGKITMLLMQAGALPSQVRIKYPQYNDRITFIDTYGLVEHEVASYPTLKSTVGNSLGDEILYMLRTKDRGLAKKLFSYEPNMIFIDQTVPEQDKRAFESLGFRIIWDKLDTFIMVKDAKHP